MFPGFAVRNRALPGWDPREPGRPASKIMKEQSIRVLVNPKAGRGKSAERLVELTELAERKGWSLEIRRTEYPGHARILAGEAREDGVPVLAVIGGDGTISDVADELTGSPVALALIPGGTGNDIARSLGISPEDIGSTFSRIEIGATIKYDVGLERVNGRRFVSFIGCGFPALVAENANRMRLLKGRMVFFISLYAMVRRMKGIPVAITVDGVREEMICTSIMVHNTPYTGGGLKIAPGALVDDGELDVVVVGEIGALELMRNFPGLYAGTHLNHPAFRLVRGKRIGIELPERQLVSYDGETGWTEKLDIEVLPGALRIIV